MYTNYKKCLNLLAVLVLITSSLVFSPRVNAQSTGDLQANWQTTQSLTSPTQNESTLAVNGFIYVLGGYSSVNGTSSSVYYAPINQDKSVGTWQTGPDLPVPLQDSVVGTNNGYIYIGSGFSSIDCASATIYYSKINSDGSLGAWQTSPNVATDCLQDAMGGISNGYMYLVGGFDDTGSTSTVYYAKLNSDGTLGTWQTTTSLPATEQDATTIFSNGNMYIIGGSNNGTAINAVQYASINSDGTLGTWQTTTSLPDTIAFSSATTYNGYVYIFGGVDVSNILDTVYYSKINNDGSLGSWQTSQFSIPEDLISLSASSNDNYFYLIGGDNGSGPSNTVYYASVAPILSAPDVSSSSDTGGTNVINAPDTGYGQIKNNNTIYYFASGFITLTLGLLLFYLIKRKQIMIDISKSDL